MPAGPFGGLMKAGRNAYPGFGLTLRRS